MQNNFEKYASEAYSLLLVKSAEEQASTYAGVGFKHGLIGGAAAGAGKPLYDWFVRGAKPKLTTPIKGSLATAALWGIGGGLAGGLIKRKNEVGSSYPQY